MEQIERLLAKFSFDWFQFTIPAPSGAGMIEDQRDEEAAISAAIQWAESVGLHPGRTAGGKNGYRIALPFSDGPEGDKVASLASGSITHIMPNLTITGGDGAAARLAPLAQQDFPGLRLSRADTACDMSKRGLWDDLLSMAQALAKGNRKLGSVRVITSDTGRTFYLGSGKSTVSLRVYEKDKERLAAGKIDEEDCDPDLVRVEFTFRPQSKAKVGAGHLSPGQLIRSSVWARDFVSRLAAMTGVTCRAVKLRPQRIDKCQDDTTLAGSALHGARQFGGTFCRLAIARLTEERHGGSYAAAVFTPKEIEAEAAMIFFRMIGDDDAGRRAIEREGVDRPETVRSRHRRILIGVMNDARKASTGKAEAADIVAGRLRAEGHTGAAAEASDVAARARKEAA